MRAEFTDDLITGNELIDSQHEEIFHGVTPQTHIESGFQK